MKNQDAHREFIAYAYVLSTDPILERVVFVFVSELKSFPKTSTTVVDATAVAVVV